MPANAPFVKVPRAIIAALARLNLTAGDLRVMLVIYDELYHYVPKDSPAGLPKGISAYAFRRMTGLPRRTIKRAVRNLERLNLISVERVGREVSIFRVNSPEQWRQTAPRVGRPNPRKKERGNDKPVTRVVTAVSLGGS